MPDRKYSPGRRRMAVRRLAGPNESSACRPVFPALRSGTQATSGNGLTGFRNPQNPMDAHLRVNRKNPLSPHSVSFRPSRLPTSGTLRNRTSPRLSPQHASPPWGRPRSARFFTCGNTSPNETQRRDTSRNEKSPRPKPLRTASYRLGGRPPLNDVAPPSGSAADRRKSRRRPPSATTHPPAGRAENSPRRKAGTRSIRREKRGHPPPHVYRRKATPYPGIPNGRIFPSARCPSQPQRAAPDGLRQRAGPVRKRSLRLRIRVFESEKCNRTRRSIEAYTFRLPLRRLCLLVFDSATIRRGEFGGHPVNG